MHTCDHFTRIKGRECGAAASSTGKQRSCTGHVAAIRSRSRAPVKRRKRLPPRHMEMEEGTAAAAVAYGERLRRACRREFFKARSSHDAERVVAEAAAAGIDVTRECTTCDWYVQAHVTFCRVRERAE